MKKRLLLSLTLLAPVANCLANSADDRPICEVWQNSSIVFAGRIISSESSCSTRGQCQNTARVSVKKIYKGSENFETVCTPVPLNAGDKYLFFGNADKKNCDVRVLQDAVLQAIQEEFYRYRSPNSYQVFKDHGVLYWSAWKSEIGLFEALEVNETSKISVSMSEYCSGRGNR